ncbi:hypothetical protein Ddye_024986 [Dipteronia dyeriana]|uniref:DNA-directed RNA polymerase n=1 Tax=Dipteronia dyeriana TaxID=168575 RepID=A0AAD9TWW0_9ROSI|nr:hypothetical protein Ddye_024986 [Dipteronia dyeriana]
MRNPYMDDLRKSELLKSIIKKCNTMANKACLRCGYINGMVKKAVTVLGIIHDRSKVNDESLEEFKSAIFHIKESKASISSATYIIDPIKVLYLFKRMTDEDCELLYLSDRPVKLMITNLAVPPTAIRPSVVMDDGLMSNENDITVRMKLIIQANNNL